MPVKMTHRNRLLLLKNYTTPTFAIKKPNSFTQQMFVLLSSTKAKSQKAGLKESKTEFCSSSQIGRAHV